MGGTEGHLHIDAPWFSDGRFTVYKGDDETTAYDVKAPMDLYAMEAEAFAAAAQEGCAPWLTEQDTVGNLAWLDGLCKSGGVGLWVGCGCVGVGGGGGGWSGVGRAGAVGGKRGAERV